MKESSDAKLFYLVGSINTYTNMIEELNKEAERIGINNTDELSITNHYIRVFDNERRKAIDEFVKLIVEVNRCVE